MDQPFDSILPHKRQCAKLQILDIQVVTTLASVSTHLSNGKAPPELREFFKDNRSCMVRALQRRGGDASDDILIALLNKKTMLGHAFWENGMYASLLFETCNAISHSKKKLENLEKLLNPPHAIFKHLFGGLNDYGLMAANEMLVLRSVCNEINKSAGKSADTLVDEFIEEAQGKHPWTLEEYLEFLKNHVENAPWKVQKGYQEACRFISLVFLIENNKDSFLNSQFNTLQALVPGKDAPFLIINSYLRELGGMRATLLPQSWPLFLFLLDRKASHADILPSVRTIFDRFDQDEIVFFIMNLHNAHPFKRKILLNLLDERTASGHFFWYGSHRENDFFERACLPPLESTIEKMLYQVPDLPYTFYFAKKLDHDLLNILLASFLVRETEQPIVELLRNFHAKSELFLEKLNDFKIRHPNQKSQEILDKILLHLFNPKTPLGYAFSMKWEYMRNNHYLDKKAISEKSIYKALMMMSDSQVNPSLNEAIFNDQSLFYCSYKKDILIARWEKLNPEVKYHDLNASPIG